MRQAEWPPDMVKEFRKWEKNRNPQAPLGYVEWKNGRPYEEFVYYPIKPPYFEAKAGVNREEDRKGCLTWATGHPFITIGILLSISCVSLVFIALTIVRLLNVY